MFVKHEIFMATGLQDEHKRRDGSYTFFLLTKCHIILSVSFMSTTITENVLIAARDITAA